jgi:hypothetical protein
MRLILFIIPSLFLLIQCNSAEKKSDKRGANAQIDSLKPIESVSDINIEEQKEDYETAFIVVLDTSDQFQKMYDLAIATSKQYHVPFDTIEKTYYPETNIWGVSMNSEDEIYHGEYFPRRDGSNSDLLSLEYQNWYDNGSREKNLMLVTNIFSFSLDAEANVAYWRQFFPNAFILQREVYMGCMH